MNQKYIGTTVNERLHVSGLMDEFDKAVKNKDTKKVIDILREVEITDEETLRQILTQLEMIQHKS